MRTKNNENKKKILIVDDDPNICVTLREIFKQNGFLADSFTEPLLALNSVKGGSYDLLLLDIKMPEMDGIELSQQIKKIDNAVKVCFLTASELYYEEFRKDLGVGEPTLDKDLFLRKPIQNEDLMKEITRIIGTNE